MNKKSGPSRRKLLTTSLAASVAASGARAGAGDPAITKVQPWAQVLGKGVDERCYPARLVVPGWEGNMWIKWLRRLEVGDQPWHHREETARYTDLLATGKSRRFTWMMDAK